MPIQFVSQLAQMRDTWMVIADVRKSESEAPDQGLELMELAAKSIDKFLNDVCSELDIRITPVEAQIPTDMQVASQMTKEYLTCSKLSDDCELPDSVKETLNKNRDLTHEKQQLVLFADDLLRTSDEPMAATAMHTALYEKIFVPSNQFPPFLQIMLIQEVCDEIFGYGPLSPFIRVFPEMEMLQDGSFRALKQVVGVKEIVPVDKPLQVEFDNDLHREEVLALFKLNCRSVTEDGFVEYTREDTWKMRIPKGIAEVIESKQTHMEKLGLLTIEKNETAPTMLQKIGDWFSTQFGRSRTPAE